MQTSIVNKRINVFMPWNGSRVNEKNLNWGKSGNEKILETQTETREAKLTSRIQEMKKRISGIEDTIEESDNSFKANVKSKIASIKHLRNMRWHEKAESKKK